MSTAPEQAGRSHFACTKCGLCCNRSPEVQLSEAAALADTFVFRLMFRLYMLPRSHSARSEAGMPPTGSAEAFYESKRLLSSFAARKYPAKTGQGAKAGEQVKYLLISALSLDTGAGACAALGDGLCSIYERRPLACRSVPFHYSRPEASAERDLAAFAARPGYRCDTSPKAPIVFEQGRIVDPAARRARADAMLLSARDRNWQSAILRRLKAGPGDHGLPSLREIEANAPLGITTVSMRVAWQIAAEAGLIGAETCRALIAAQAGRIDRDLALSSHSADTRETLIEMRAEYRRPTIDPPSCLNRGDGAPGASGRRPW